MDAFVIQSFVSRGFAGKWEDVPSGAYATHADASARVRFLMRKSDLMNLRVIRVKGGKMTAIVEYGLKSSAQH